MRSIDAGLTTHPVDDFYLNKVTILGNLGQDPQVHTSNVTSISVATTENWKDQSQECTQWHRIVFYSGLAEAAAQYLKKGSKIYVSGSLRTRKWQDKHGADNWTTEVIAHDFQMLDRKPPDKKPTKARRKKPQQAELQLPDSDFFDDEIAF